MPVGPGTLILVRALGGVVLLLMLIAAVYAVGIALQNYERIGV